MSEIVGVVYWTGHRRDEALHLLGTTLQRLTHTQLVVIYTEVRVVLRANDLGQVGNMVLKKSSLDVV